MNWTPLPSDGLLWVSVDFDQTIADNTGYPDFIPTKPLDGVKENLEKLEAGGYKIIIFTARPWADYANIEKFMEEHSLPFRRIVCGKLLAKYYIDDRNAGGLNWDIK
jgi:phosphoglycolate phosphatase-like HAD superfamily hydrolase